MTERSNKTFRQRLDYYWQSIVIYLIVLAGYSLIRGILQNKQLSFFFEDPIVILLAVFIIVSLVMYLYKLVWVRSIVVEDDALIFKNRFHTQKHTLEDIEYIYLGKERPFQSRETYRLIKIKLKNKKRKIRIRPYNYWDDKQLYEDIRSLKDRLRK